MGNGDGLFMICIVSIVIGFVLGHMYGFGTAKASHENLASELYKCIDKDGKPFIDEKSDENWDEAWGDNPHKSWEEHE